MIKKKCLNEQSCAHEIIKIRKDQKTNVRCKEVPNRKFQTEKYNCQNNINNKILKTFINGISRILEATQERLGDGQIKEENLPNLRNKV